MKISIIGLGYVGSVTAACFAEAGHHVIGVDVSDIKVSAINSGQAPVAELGLAELVSSNVKRGRLVATTDIDQAWDESEVIIVSVGTPSARSGDVYLDDLDNVVADISRLLACSTGPRKTLVITSTVPPGTLNSRIKPVLQAGQTANPDGIGLAFSPEFLREGTAIQDFMQPEKVVIGSNDSATTETLLELFRPFHLEPVVTTPEVAECVKFAANTWHGLKVAFANEMARICSANTVDSVEMMNIFKSDTKLNISDRYLNPGFAFGGSCLPKDLRTITYRARSQGVRVPVLDSLLESNDEHQAFALDLIEGFQQRRILMLGLAFKAGTDDLRESPAVPLAERLLGKGRDLKIYDEWVQLDKLMGANKRYVVEKLPHLAKLLVSDLDNEIQHAELIIIAQSNKQFATSLASLTEEHVVVDLTGSGRGVQTRAKYVGLAW